ncbi:gliding motility-associated ABC transporter ATP-binding subunit GldA [Flavicella marina]|uniref:gliding motility-associated ABC transporter ATP-binding subunit GldA n=1 Tax=Flavicella marina TaxID=1475951 RepID=UPI00126576B0|nr:gliding motility-associated ABC transporter ATP-binding subunit GldA [Flavicella marina]
MSIKVTDISKYYDAQKALDTVGFSIEKGEVVGFLGPNGAGKSTLMKILTGFLLPDEGCVMVCGIDVELDPINAQKKIGYLPEQNPLYEEMYVREYLLFVAELHGVQKNNIETLVERIGLTPEANKKIKELSKGFKQRVGLAAALLHDPEVLILDEPTTGLDPNQLIEIRELIKELGTNKIVLFSTHIMQEVEAVCDRVLILKNGKIIADENLQELKAQQQQVIEVAFDFQIEERFLKEIPYLEKCICVSGSNWELYFSTAEDMRSEVFDFANKNGLKIIQLNTQNKNLESLFTELTS